MLVALLVLMLEGSVVSVAMGTSSQDDQVAVGTSVEKGSDSLSIQSRSHILHEDVNV